METYSDIVIHWTDENSLMNIIKDNKIDCPCSLTDYRWFGRHNSNIPSDEFSNINIEVQYDNGMIFESDDENNNTNEKLNENEFNSLLNSGDYGLRWQYGIIFEKNDLNLTFFKDLVEKSEGKIIPVYLYEYEREYNSNKDISLDLSLGLVYVGDINENILHFIKRRFKIIINEKNMSDIFNIEKI